MTCLLVPQAVSLCPSAIGSASGEFLADLTGGRAWNGRRGEVNCLDFNELKPRYPIL